MRTKVERVLLSLVAVTAGTMAAAASGCITNPVTSPDVDGGGLPDLDSSLAPSNDAAVTPPTDSAAPPRDTGTTSPVDATLPEDSSTPEDSSAPVDSAPPVDAHEAGPAGSFIRFAWLVGTGASGASGPSGPSGGTGPQFGHHFEPLAPAQPVDAGPVGYDVCVAPHGTGAWQGPLLSTLVGGLQPYDVTSYFPVTAGQYDVRIVSSTAGTCFIYGDGGVPASDAGTSPDDGGDASDDGATSTADAGSGEDAATADAGPPPTDFTNLPPIPPGVSISVVLVPPSSSQIADVFAFVDDTTTSAGKAKLRFVNVSETDFTGPGDAGPDGGDDAGTVFVGQTYGLGGSYFFSPLFNDVTSHEGVDPTQPNGYLEMDPVTGVNSSVAELAPSYPGGSSGGSGPAEPSIDVSGGGLSLVAGSLTTAFYVEQTGGAGPALVTCSDGVPNATTPQLTSCNVTLGQTDSAVSYTRFGNFLADTSPPNVDVCLKYHGYGGYVGPLLAQFGSTGTSGGVPANAISTYIPTNGGYAFDARYVAAGATDCSTSLVDLTYDSLTASGGGYVTVLLSGFTTVPEDAGTIPPYDGGPVIDASGDDAGQPIDVPLPTLAGAAFAIDDVPYNADPFFGGFRFVHVDADHPQPITLTITDTTTDAGIVVQDTPYGGISTNPAPIASFGYVVVPSDPLTLAIDSSTWGTSVSDPQSLFAYGSATGTQLLQCDDYNEVAMVVGSTTFPCTVLTPGSGDIIKLQPKLPNAKPPRVLLRQPRGR